MEDTFQLSGRVVLITGANNPKGIGAAVGRAFAEQGARVFLHGYRRGNSTVGVLKNVPGDELYQQCGAMPIEYVADKISSIGGGNVASVEGDISDEKFIETLFDTCETRLGSVDILINNAASMAFDEDHLKSSLGSGDTILGSSAAIFDRVFSVNARGTLLMMREFASRFVARRAKRGSIVNISSDGAHGPFPGEILYGASKYAIESFTTSAAHELGPYGLRVNVVAPGPTQTGWIASDFEKRLKGMIPLGKIGAPEEIADVVVFMASHQARWITGQVLWVNGGFRM